MVESFPFLEFRKVVAYYSSNVKTLSSHFQIRNLSFHHKPVSAVRGGSAIGAAGLSTIGLLLVFAPLLEGGTTHFAVMVIRLLIATLAGLALYRAVRAQEIETRLNGLGKPLLSYLALALCSTLFSPYQNQSMQWLIVLLGYSALLYLLISFMADWKDVSALLSLLVLMGCFESALSFWQLWQGDPRPVGTFFNPNFLAGYLVGGWLLGLSYLCYLPSRQIWKQNTLTSARAVLTAPLWILLGGVGLTLAIAWTGSRGAALAACTGSMVVIGLRYGRKGVAVFLFLLLMAALVPSPVRERFYIEHVLNPVAYARWQMWQGALHMMADHPMGVGLGLYQYLYPPYAFPVDQAIARYGKIAQTPHNEFLQMGVELGVLSLGIVAWGTWIIGQHVKWILSQRLKRGQRRIIVGVAGGVVALFTHSAVDSNLHEPALAIVLVLFIGIILFCRRLLEEKHTTSVSKNVVRVAPSWGWLGFAIIIVAIVGVVRLGTAWTWYEAGGELHRKGNITGAIEYYRTAILLDPGKALYHSGLAAAEFSLYERQHDLSIARDGLDELCRAIILNPLDGRLAGLLGQVYVRFPHLEPQSDLGEQGCFSYALTAYRQAIQLEPFNPFYYLESSRLYVKSGDDEKAERFAKTAIEIEPNFLSGRAWLAKIYAQSGRMSLAELEYREIVERQQRYANWNKSPREEQLLTVDTNGLATFLDARRERR